MTLSETEKFALARINADYARMTMLVYRDVEARLGLPAGSLGQTHVIQPDGNVVMTPEAAAHFARMAAQPPTAVHLDRPSEVQMPPNPNGPGLGVMVNTPAANGDGRQPDPGTP